MSIRRWSAIGFLLFVAGCGSTGPAFVAPELPSAFPDHTLPSIASEVSQSISGVESLETRSRIRFETPNENRSVNLDIKYRRDDSLYVSAKVTLGIEAVKSLVTPDSFFVFDRLHKRRYYGPIEQAYRLLPDLGPTEDIFENITGTVGIDVRKDWQVSHDSSYYYLSTRDLTTTITVDPRLWRVTAVEARSPSGVVLEQRSYSDFDSFGDFVIPRRIEIMRPEKRERFQIYHRRVIVNPDPFEISFELGRVRENILVSAED